MKLSNVLKRRPESRGRYLTLDSKIHSRDGVNGVPSDAELAAYFAARAKVDLGTVWNGDSLAQTVNALIADMPVKDRAAAAKAVRDALESEGFGGVDADQEHFKSETMREGEGPFNSTSTHSTRDRKRRLVQDANGGFITSPLSINETNRRHYAAQSQPTAPARDNKPKGSSIAEINAVNRAHYSAQEPFRYGPKYGKG
jgi:hypothetical protein